MNYQKRLRDLREDRDITQTQIAEVLCVKQSAVSRYENGSRTYRIEDLIKLCQFYNVSHEYILGFNDEFKSLT